MKTHTVYLGACADYDVAAIGRIILGAVEQIGFDKPLHGHVVIKPNLVLAHPRVATDSYTRPEVIEGILRLIQPARESGLVKKVSVVEKSGLGVSTGAMYRYAGYRPLKKRYDIALRALEDGPRVIVGLERGQVHHHITIAREMAERDFLIFAPKLKTNVLTQAYSGAMKLNIGTIDGRERLFHHHMDLPIKIVDLLEAANPDLIVTDGIRMAFGGNQMTQHGTNLGVVVVSTNAVAHDWVCAELLNLDPLGIDHIREAGRRGYGPSSIDEINIVGDFPLERARIKTRNLDYGYVPVHQFVSNLKIESGTPYCTGGCHGIFLDWLHMIKDRKPGLLKRFPSIPVLVGRVISRIEARKVLLVGDCALASPNIRAKKIIRIRGCPPSHKRIIWDMMIRLRLLAPLVRPSLVFDAYGRYPVKKIIGWLQNWRIRRK